MCRLCTIDARYDLHDRVRDRLCAVCADPYPVVTTGVLWFCGLDHAREHEVQSTRV